MKAVARGRGDSRRKRPPRAAPSPPAPSSPAPSPPAPPLRLAHPAMLMAVLVVAAIVVLSVTYDTLDPDQWQHLAVGRFIWAQHRFPTIQLWTWPTYGARDVDYAWGFEALAWPFWKYGGVTGLYLWRWLTTLAALGLGWVASRKMGAKGFAPLVAGVLCAMVYRGRTQVRPETIAAILLAAEILVLEARRHGGRVHPFWLLPIALIWANTHLTYYNFLFVLGIHALVASLPGRGPDALPAKSLWITGLASLGVMLVNPSGWRTLWQPFYHFFELRHEPIFKNIVELAPLQWSLNWRNGLPLLVVGWPALALARFRRQALDWVEVLMCAGFTASVLFSQRFVGVYALAALPYVGRDLHEWVQRRSWPSWTRPAWSRAGLALAGCLLVAVPELSRPDIRIRMRLPLTTFTPVAACDFIESHGLRGRFFNPQDLGGYICFRFWPDRGRLPFIGAHQEGTRELRGLYAFALLDARGWRLLEDRYRFDVILIPRCGTPSDNLPLTLDADSSWARVFGDDVAQVLVPRDGPFAALARDSAYLVLPTDPRNLTALGRRTISDPSLRRRLERELWREVAGSPWHAEALSLLANIAIIEARWDDGRRELDEALRIKPMIVGAREKLGMIALMQDRPREALHWFEEERRVLGYRNGLDFRRGQVAEAEGSLPRALALYRAELRRDPGNEEFRDSVESLSTRLAR
jgi:hypothetical protein